MGRGLMLAPQRFPQFQTRRSASFVSENGTYRRFLSVRYSIGNDEGFRMPACGDLSAPAEGRRPKASQEGTLGGPVGGCRLWRFDGAAAWVGDAPAGAAG